MKNTFFILALITIFAVSCNKDDNDEINEEQQEEQENLYESNLAFINSDWTFNATGDSLKDQIIGLWLSNKVSYDDTLCTDCDSLFTWVIESTGIMTKRNNDWGDNETMAGNWELDTNNEFIFFSFKEYATGGTLNNYRIVTDTISIEQLSKNNLWTSQFINYPPTTKMNIRFNKLK